MATSALAPPPAPGADPGLPPLATAAAKILLLGEHAVVYGSHALAAPIPHGMQARVSAREGPCTHLSIPAWEVDTPLQWDNVDSSLHACVSFILRRMGAAGAPLTVALAPRVPPGSGLGASAALAVALVRAVAAHQGRPSGDAEVNALAFAAEQLAHGTASGVDNTVATYGQFVLFCRGTPPAQALVRAPRPIPVVIGLTGVGGPTRAMVARVAAAQRRQPRLYAKIFAAIDALAQQGRAAVEAYDLPQLGALMDLNHGWLNALQVSHLALEELVHLARARGALGAKLTGSGGGGAMIALCPERREAVAAAIRQRGYQALCVEIGGVPEPPT